MPTAFSRPDAELAFTTSHFSKQTRNTLTFQITPRLSGSLRYSLLYNIRMKAGGAVSAFLFDRSFSLHYRFLDETDWRPAVAVGLNDFLGTGVYSSEYVVASKTITPRLRFTGGIGWGRLAGVGAFGNPLSVISGRFKTRPSGGTGNGGLVRTNNWFRGDAALFGGVEWQATDRLALAMEYSSDSYPIEAGAAFERKSPFNFGATYKVRPSVLLGVNYLYGSEVGVRITFATNPKNPRYDGGLDKAPPAVVQRRKSAVALGWGDQITSRATTQSNLKAILQEQGITLHGLDVSATNARVQIENDTYFSSAQAIGRTARALTGTMPANIETFEIVTVVKGMSGSVVTIKRRDIEQLEYKLDSSWESYTRAVITTERGTGAALEGLYPRFKYDLGPYVSPALFDPDAPVRADIGVEAKASFEPAQGLVFSGRVRQKLAGNLNKSTRVSTSVIQKVRSESYLYDKASGPTLNELTAAYYFKPGENLYGRVTAGYLEEMYGGVSAELLWKAPGNAFALGGEINYVKQRDFNQKLGFQNYNVLTGHASVYWDVGNGFSAQVDAGRYLAGDWGTTLTVEREFKNGWKIGAFATLTNVPFNDFGEGSFDKGLRLTVPIGWLSGKPDRQITSKVIRPILRDGGARLNVSGRLYDELRGTQGQELRDSWGRFWR